MPFNDDLNTTDTGMFAMRQQPSDAPGLSLAAEQVSRQYLYQLKAAFPTDNFVVEGEQGSCCRVQG
jgi:hypothetical protein